MTKFAIISIKLPVKTSNNTDDPAIKAADRILDYVTNCKNTEILGEHVWLIKDTENSSLPAILGNAGNYNFPYKLSIMDSFSWSLIQK
jgi:hypothetical protein